MNELIVVLGDQLVQGLPGLPKDGTVFMAEDMELCTRTRHHRQKITLFLSAMRHFAAELRSTGRDVRYCQLDPTEFGGYMPRLVKYCQDHGFDSVVMYEPADAFFREAINQSGLTVRFVPNPAFLTDGADWSSYAGGRKRLLMGDFYKRQRQKMSVLIDAAGGPEGGKWSFDEDNRKPLPKKLTVPEPWYFEPDSVTSQVIELVDAVFTDHPGKATQFRYPVTHSQAKEWLAQFVSERLANFGTYEDALSVEHRVIFHSLLSPLMNCGLLTPREVLDAIADTDAPINAREGFIRQMIGWREFVRGIDRLYSSSHPLDLSSGGFFGSTRALNACWYDGTTGLPPLDLVIRRAQYHGYAHHIERLMIAGSAMLMAEVHPEAAFDWFMEMFIDSAEWVMRPNVFGMSLFADGGLFATKPYFSGSAYLLRMGDFAKGDWCDTWDGLYWRFISKHRDFFASNPRMSVMVNGLDKLEAARKLRIFTAAEAFIDRTTTAKAN